MLNWFTFGVMFITIVLLMVTCYYLEFKKKSENQTIENLLKTYINICDSLEDEKKNLKEKIQKLFDFYKNTGYYELEDVLKELLEEVNKK